MSSLSYPPPKRGRMSPVPSSSRDMTSIPRDMTLDLLPSAMAGDADMVEVALRDPDSRPNQVIFLGWTALMLSASYGFGSVVSVLLSDARLDPNIRTNHGATALTIAAGEGHESVVEYLLRDKRVNPGIAAQDGNTALIRASRWGHAPVVAVLLRDKRIDPNAINNDGMTALMAAAASGLTAVVKLLMADRRVDPNTRNKYGHTALLAAAHFGHDAVLRVLLRDDRTARVCPAADDAAAEPRSLRSSADACSRDAYESALRAVKRPRRNLFCALVFTAVHVQRMRLRAAERAYAPGAAGYEAAAESFRAAAHNQQMVRGAVATR